MAAVRIDRADDDGRADAAGARPEDLAEATGSLDPPGGGRSPDAARRPGASWSPEASRPSDGRDPRSPPDAAARVAAATEYRATVEAANRAYAIDRGYARVSEIERETVTPAMKRIEAEDPHRHLVGLENRLKGKDRLAEKVTKIVNERGHSVEAALGLVKDAIRYTLCYPEHQYTAGVCADWERLKDAGFQPVERENSWTEEQYKGINSRWRVAGGGQLFEVQFHTQASMDAKEETHWAYEKLRVGVPTPAEQRELEGFQKRVTASVPVPPGATDIPNYP